MVNSKVVFRSLENHQNHFPSANNITTRTHGFPSPNVSFPIKPAFKQINKSIGKPKLNHERLKSVKYSREQSFLSSVDDPSRMKCSKDRRFKKPKFLSEALRDKAASIKYSRDYSFLFVDEEGSKENGDKISSQMSLQEAECNDGVKCSKHDGSATKVEGNEKKVSDQLGSGKKDAVGETKKRLVIRFRITADGKAKRITDSNLDKVGTQQESQKPACHGVHGNTLEGRRDIGDKAMRAASLVKDIFKEMMEEESSTAEITKKKEIKDEDGKERFKICAPRWKRICRPKVSLGRPRSCAH